MKRQLLCSAIFFSAFTFLVTPASAQSTGTCCGKVGVGTTTISDGSGSGGQELFLDVAGAAGATYYCDENGLNCFTAASASGSAAAITQGNSNVTVTDAGDGYIAMTEDGTEYLRLTSGKVGIGTNNPSALLTLQTSSTGAVFTIKNSSGTAWFMANNANSDATPVPQLVGSGAYISLYGAAGNGIVFRNTGSATNTSFSFNDYNNATIMRLLNSGELGIGTTSPSSLLDLQKAGTAKANTNIFEITNSGNAADMDGTTSSVLFNQFYYDATTPAVADAAQITVGTETDWTSTASTQDSYLALSTALDGTVAEKMRITSAGYVGIGSSAPTVPLYVRGAAGPQVTVKLNSATTTEYAGIQLLNDNNAQSNITFNQNTYTPANNAKAGQLQINSNGAGGVLLNAANASGTIDFVTGTYAGAFGSNLAIRINATGNVGIGTTSPTELFDINSSTLRLRTAKTPASASDTCDQGEIAWDADYVYVCVATNTWKRSGLATW